MNAPFYTLGIATGETSETAENTEESGSKENKVVYTNDFDGAYHVEQDDESEDVVLIKNEPW